MIKEGQIFSFENTVKFWTKHIKMSDRTTKKIISVTNRTLASAYVLCHPTLLLSLFQKYRMEISSRIEKEIQEMTTREEWEKLGLFSKLRYIIQMKGLYT